VTPPARPARRPLTFHDLDDVLRDVDALAAGGYDRAGNWDLAQACRHLAEWMRFAVDGYPRSPLPVRLIFAALRPTIGRSVLRKTLDTGSMGAGSPTLRETVPAPAADPMPAVAELRRTIERFRDHRGEYHASPLFGALTRDQMTQLHLVHCAHHLSFLVPAAPRA
jgi:hypothetical protein